MRNEKKGRMVEGKKIARYENMIERVKSIDSESLRDIVEHTLHEKNEQTKFEWANLLLDVIDKFPEVKDTVLKLARGENPDEQGEKKKELRPERSCKKPCLPGNAFRL